ncbi:MAG: glycosyltransferase family 4 protein [Chloroherpetonaceae bacterium]|nr:glycosyltransferase family 4 protein [Chloroherpetonaceae bacterium]
MRKPKILHIITVFSIGGATEGTLALAKGLQEKGYEVEIATGYHVPAEGSLLSEAAASGVPVTLFPDLVKEISPLRDLRAFLDLYRFIQQGRFDIVHTHTAKAGILGRLAARLAGVPLVFHTLHLLSFHAHQPPVLRRLFIGLERFAARFTTAFASVSQTMIERHLQQRIGQPEQYRVIRSGLHESFFQPCDNVEALRAKYAARFGFQSTDFVVAKISRLTKLKGHQFLIEAAPHILEAVPSAKFLLVGGGDYEPQLRQLVRQRQLDTAVRFTGVVPPAEVAALVRISDVIVHTSLHEGLARVIQEAMASAKPIVCFNLDGAAEMIVDGQNGFLIPASPITRESIRLLAEKIILLAKAPELRRQLGENAHQRAFPEFTTAFMTDAVEKMYLEYLSAKQVSQLT